jgi:hypothetical protein
MMKGFGDFKIGRHLICIVKYACDVVLLAKEEAVVQGMIDGKMKLEYAKECE